MRDSVKAAVYRLAKMAGLFRLSRRLTSRKLRILCYHGVALHDEHRFRPGLFIRPETFAGRLAYLADHGYPVLELGMAMARLADGTLPRDATVITIDDGWYGTARHMAPLLAQYVFPSTLYVATYYLSKQTMVFNVAAAYALWKSAKPELDLAAVAPALAGVHALGTGPTRELACSRLCAHADTLDAAGREALLESLCSALDVDYEFMREHDMFRFMTEAEARAATAHGMDLQLHTHRHQLPETSAAALEGELGDNRRALAAVTAKPLVHFCYPSGEYSASQLPWLAAAGIQTATTTRMGFNTPATPPLELRRFLDSEALSELEFEAECCGFKELVRGAVARLRGAGTDSVA